MIYKVTKNEQLNTCLDIIHKSFQTVADDMNLTKENCPSHTAFMPLEKLQNQFKTVILCFYMIITMQLWVTFH